MTRQQRIAAASAAARPARTPLPRRAPEEPPPREGPEAAPPPSGARSRTAPLGEDAAAVCSGAAGAAARAAQPVITRLYAVRARRLRAYNRAVRG